MKEHKFYIEDRVITYYGERPETVLEAVELSIEKWEFIEKNKKDYYKLRCGGFKTCGLCMMFHSKYFVDCLECPLVARGEYCMRDGSVYDKWQRLGETQPMLDVLYAIRNELIGAME